MILEVDLSFRFGIGCRALLWILKRTLGWRSVDLSENNSPQLTPKLTIGCLTSTSTSNDSSVAALVLMSRMVVVGDWSGMR